MKTIVIYLLMVFSLMACHNEQQDPVPVDLRPLRMDDVDGYRELQYDDTGKITGLLIVTKFVDGTEKRETQNFVYDSTGKLIESRTDAGWDMRYTYNDRDQLVSTDVYADGSRYQRHVYTYNSKRYLSERITYEGISDEALIPVSKEYYAYDNLGNVTLQLLYAYDASGQAARITTRFTFSDYDNRTNIEKYFIVTPFNPTLTLCKNNPGKMVVENATGSINSVETYTYQYNDHGYVTEKTSHLTLHNGSSGSYLTRYSFK